MGDQAARQTDLRKMLSERRLLIQDAVRSRIRAERSDRATDVLDDIERSDVGTQGDITFSLLQLRAEALRRIDEALVRLDAGQYGSCTACDGDISEPRLRALPFAVRCHVCERIREEAAHARRLARRRTESSHYAVAVRS